MRYGIIGAAAFASLWITASTPAHAQEGQTDMLPLLKTFMSEFIEVTPGAGKFPASFTLGSTAGEASEQPPHEVTLTSPFHMAKYEVPQNLYEAVMGENPSRWKGPRNSAEMMTFAEAEEFCRKLTRALHEAKLLPETDVIRLPTETEWEYCCRAGSESEYCFGNLPQQPGDAEPKATILDAYGWHTGNAAGNDPPVGALAPNLWGFYDMHGYLSEFCSDPWRANYEDGAKPVDGQHVIRGGSWKDHYRMLRSAARRPFDDEARSDAIGFRCVQARAD